MLRRSRRRAPNLAVGDRLLCGFGSLFLSPGRIRRVAIGVRPSTLLTFHQALVRRKYRRLFSGSQRPKKPGPPGPSEALIRAIVERGGFVEIGGNYAMGTPVMLRFGFPLIDEVLCTGVVRHHKPGVGVGVEFLNLVETDREHLAGLVRGKARGDPTGRRTSRRSLMPTGGCECRAVRSPWGQQMGVQTNGRYTRFR